MASKPTLYSTLTITSSQVLPTNGYALVLIDATAGNVTVTIPAVSNFYLRYGVMFSRKDTTANIATISVPDAVDGYTSIILSAGESIQIVSDYTTWHFSNGYVNDIAGARDLAVTSASPRGMIAYNTNIVFGPIGLYYSDGSSWIQLDAASTSSVHTAFPIMGNGSSIGTAVTFVNGTIANQIWKWDSGTSAWIASTVSDEITTSGFVTGDGSVATPIKLINGTSNGQIPQWSGTWDLRNALVGSTIYVNTLGDDGTAQVNNPMRAYATLDAAIAAAAALPSGNLKFIRVSPGTYAASANFAIANTSYYFDSGCTVNHSGDVLAPVANIAKTSITGYADITCSRLINFTAFQVTTCQIAANSITCSAELLTCTGISSSNMLQINANTITITSTPPTTYDGDGTIEIIADTLSNSTVNNIISFSNSTSVVFILKVNILTLNGGTAISSASTVSGAQMHISISSITGALSTLFNIDSPSTTLVAVIGSSVDKSYSFGANSAGSIAELNFRYISGVSISALSAMTITVTADYMTNVIIQPQTAGLIYTLNVKTLVLSLASALITSGAANYQFTINAETLITSASPQAMLFTGTGATSVINIGNIIHSGTGNILNMSAGILSLVVNYISSTSVSGNPIIYIDQTASINLNIVSGNITNKDPIVIGTAGAANTVKANILLGSINVTPANFVMAFYGTSTSLIYVRGRICWVGSGTWACVYLEPTNVIFDNCVFADSGTDPESIIALNSGTAVRFYGTFTSNRALNAHVVPTIGTVTIDASVI